MASDRTGGRQPRRGSRARFRLALSVVGVLSAVSVGAQSPSAADQQRELQALTEAVKAMQQELREIKALLQRPSPVPSAPAPPAPTVPRGVVLDLGDHPSRGKADAELTLVEFSDFQCPFCARHFALTEPLLMKEYVDTGKLKVVFIDFPLESIHPFAVKAAETARCAGDQGKFWEMHDQLFRSQNVASEFSNWTAHAQKVGLKMPEFQSCLSAGKHVADIRRDVALGQGAGVSGTPGFFLAVTDPSGKQVKPLRFISGAQPYTAFKAQIDALFTQ